MDVRRIRADEGTLLRAMRIRALTDTPTAFGSTIKQTLAYSMEVWEERARSNALSDTISGFLAERDGEVVGLAGGMFEAGEPMPSLISMWVAPSARGHGGGEALIEAVVTWVRSLGATRLQLWVTETNAPAIALYRRTGFIETDETQPLPSHPALLERRMVREL